ncbi:Predicted transcriptional regulator, contains HTH domain [Haladaptatus litoreus]|uniref:Predicted transcriptional regulator, contains HTH domain n=1 Tax=Haladaptatus litoreus TaxID=553468 RepID=A0A1N6Y239_9EURY|nr:helix-turn-helix domain-containing protein [Haladaptatus litoreus]SIR08617.1 Predicted transcriptional regulator, contains HTH domain [Haladaptatus litoreus]
MSEEGATPDELIAIVTKRASFLAVLSSGAMEKRALRDELGVSRSTVYKAVRELKAYDLVERTNDGLRLTLAGRILESEYDTFRRRTEDVCRTRHLLSTLPADCGIPTALIENAETILPERHAPNHPIQYFERMVSDADCVRGLSPVALPQYVDLFYERSVSGGMAAELVLEQPVVKYLVTDYSDELREALEIGNLSVWETENTLPFGLIVAKGTTNEHDGVCVVVYNERGELRGLITNDTRNAVEWGHETFERFRNDATLVGGE